MVYGRTHPSLTDQLLAEGHPEQSKDKKTRMIPDSGSLFKPCPKCGKSVSADSRYCKYCAFDFGDANKATFTVEVGADQFCPGCGEGLGENAVFCANCGDPISKYRPTSGTSATGINRNHVMLMSGLVVVVVIAILVVLMLSRSRPNSQTSTAVQTSYENSTTSITEPTIKTSQPDRGGLTNQKVENAVNRLTSNLRTDGSVNVAGIQELPQENAARADIRFNSFQYKSDMAGTPLSKDKSTPKKPDVNSPNFYDEMYKYGTQQVQSRNYSGQGFAVLKHYNDGRWVFKEVQWEFNAWVGNVDIQ